MIDSNLPALQVVLPLIAAPVCLLLRRSLLTWLVALSATWSAAAISVAILLKVLSSGTISYAFGGWAPPWGIEYRVDALNAFVLVLVALVAAAIVPYARRSLLSEVRARQHYLFWTAYLLCLTGLLGVTITGDGFNVFVFLEISSLATYILIAYGQDRRALVASYQYLIMGTIGATFIAVNPQVDPRCR